MRSARASRRVVKGSPRSQPRRSPCRNSRRGGARSGRAGRSPGRQRCARCIDPAFADQRADLGQEVGLLAGKVEDDADNQRGREPIQVQASLKFPPPLILDPSDSNDCTRSYRGGPGALQRDLERITIGQHTRHASGTRERGSVRPPHTSPTRERGSVRPPHISPTRERGSVRLPHTSPTRERGSVRRSARPRPVRRASDGPDGPTLAGASGWYRTGCGASPERIRAVHQSGLMSEGSGNEAGGFDGLARWNEDCGLTSFGSDRAGIDRPLRPIRRARRRPHRARRSAGLAWRPARIGRRSAVRSPRS